MMTEEELAKLFEIFGALGVGAFIGGGVIYLLLKNFVPSYLAEKGKNLATREDIGKVTDEIEKVRAQYSERLQDLSHQNAVLLEQIRGHGQLRLAAVERRLHAHQEAFTLWRKLLTSVHKPEVTKVVIECQEWFNNNCLYLSPKARDAFSEAYFAANSHADFKQDRSNPEAAKSNWQTILALGPELIAGAELPPLGQDELTRLEKRVDS